MAPDVLHDLHLAAAVTSDAGLVSADDFLNPLTLGVNEGISRFMMAGGDQLSPFCYCANKLIFCRNPLRDFYANVAENFIRTNTQYSHSKTFLDLDSKWRGAVEIDYFGHMVLNFGT
jgi:hypothetical protein